MKFQLAYKFYSGILFGLFLEFVYPLYMSAKSLFSEDQLHLAYFYFLLGFIAVYIIQYYYQTQLFMNVFFANLFTEE